jgi:glycosyltransferase involved in cell wall biosynthesis
VPEQRPSDRWRTLTVLFLVVAALLVGLQIWSALITRDIVSDAKLAAVLGAKDDFEREKLRQEFISRRIENESKGVVQTVLASGVTAVALALVTIFGAFQAWRKYQDEQEKDRQARADALEKDNQARADAQQKDRAESLRKALEEALTRLVAEEPRQRIVGAAGMLFLLRKEHEEFHLQALAALVAAARMADETPAVRQGIRLAVEQAMRVTALEVRRQLSWQDVKLPGVDLTRCDLRGLDLRDAALQDARLTDARLEGADLSAAKMQGAQLTNAKLDGAILSYADMAGASIAGASLNDARIDNVQVLNLELAGADLTGVAFWRGVPWDATRDWREATFDPAVRTELDQIYGLAAPKLRVVLLMWEIPPLIAGGTWTACFHLVRNLRRRGADVTVVVPWDQNAIADSPFGGEVPVVALGITPPDAAEGSPYGNTPSWSPYGQMASSWSPYFSSAASWSPYARSSVPYGGPYGSPYSAYSRTAEGLAGSTLFRLIGEFTRRFETWLRDHPVDLIHAHDWVCFPAARAGAAATGLPWIAHFHSTEAERQPDVTDPLTERMERDAALGATRIITPGEGTRARVIAYGAEPSKVDAVPNSLSEGASPTADMGRFETRRIVFLGRLSRQKGVDRFCDLADELRGQGLDARFEVFGDGEERDTVLRRQLQWNQAVPWKDRGRAFRGASVLVVPSRAEPFGMVILEAMQHRVPVIFPDHSGAAEVLKSGIATDTSDVAGMAAHVARLLGSLEAWEAAVRAEAEEIGLYRDRNWEDRVMAIWQAAIMPRAGARVQIP